MSKTLAAQRAVGAVRNALSESGINSNLALRYARVLLSRPGVEVGSGGNIWYQGRQFSPSAFASSKLAQFVTGAQATATNEKAITSDPGYLQALASLGLQRDEAISPLQMEQRNALIQFGDPNFVQGDPATAGAAAANPFSTSALMALQYQRQNQAATEAANRMGTYTGGGLQSGLGENQRVNAAQEQDAVTKLQNLLASINSQTGQAQQAYTLGTNAARLNAYQSLLSSGAISAAHAPNLNPGSYNFRGFAPIPPPRPSIQSNGGPQPNPGPPPPPQFPTSYGNGNPPTGVGQWPPPPPSLGAAPKLPNYQAQYGVGAYG